MACVSERSIVRVSVCNGTLSGRALVITALLWVIQKLCPQDISKFENFYPFPSPLPARTIPVRKRCRDENVQLHPVGCFVCKDFSFEDSLVLYCASMKTTRLLHGT